MLRHESEVLKENPLGDPHVRDLYVYLPPDYNNRNERYPTVFCLTGFTGRGKMLLNDNAFSPNIAERMDKLIAAGTAARFEPFMNRRDEISADLALAESGVKEKLAQMYVEFAAALDGA